MKELKKGNKYYVIKQESPFKIIQVVSVDDRWNENDWRRGPAILKIPETGEVVCEYKENVFEKESEAVEWMLSNYKTMIDIHSEQLKNYRLKIKSLVDWVYYCSEMDREDKIRIITDYLGLGSSA